MTPLYNGGHEPLVPAGRWGDGVVLPGESIDVDNPETYGPPWTVNEAEAQAAARAYADASTLYPPTTSVPEPPKPPKRTRRSRNTASPSSAPAGTNNTKEHV